MPEPSKEKLCFVIGPIGDAGSPNRRHANWLLDGIIKPVFAAHFPDFTVQRADELPNPGSITSQVIVRLRDSRLVIADMSHSNVNVFYELGIRHMMTNLRTIHMILKDQTLPFDIALDRAVQYSVTEHEHLKTAQSDLKRVVEEVLKPEFVVDNPVTRAIGREEFHQHATPEMKVLFGEVEALRGRLERLEARLLKPSDYIVGFQRRWMAKMAKSDPKGLLQLVELAERLNLSDPET
jgi:hypothetical protein